MPMDPGEIERLIKDSMPDAVISIQDLASSAFKGKSRVQQHQMVYQALQGRMGGELHALALQTAAPEDA